MKDLKICLQIDFSFSFFFLFWELKHWQVSEFAMGWKEILVWSLFFTEIKNFNFSILLRVCNKPVIWRESFSRGMACYYNIRNLGGWEVLFQVEVIKTLPGTQKPLRAVPTVDSLWLTVADSEVHRLRWGEPCPQGAPAVTQQVL